MKKLIVVALGACLVGAMTLVAEAAGESPTPKEPAKVQTTKRHARHHHAVAKPAGKTEPAAK